MNHVHIFKGFHLDEHSHKLRVIYMNNSDFLSALFFGQSESITDNSLVKCAIYGQCDAYKMQ